MPRAEKPTVVLIDDDEMVLRSLRLVLMKRYTVATFTNPVEGIKAVIELKPVAVVSDIRMPGHDGFWVLRKIRDIPSDVPVIFNSAYQDISLPGDLVGTYAPFGYVIKAAGIDQFLELVDKAAATRTA